MEGRRQGMAIRSDTRSSGGGAAAIEEEPRAIAGEGVGEGAARPPGRQ
jgi:hypothetical protein